MNHRKVVHAACVFVAHLMLFSPVHAAGLFRAYLASDGNDANPCTLAAPCRLLPAALAAIADGGEIWILDSANYNTAQVNITKSVTILSVPGALGSVVANAGNHGIHIDAAGVRVALRNLVFVHVSDSTHGINFEQGAELHVADCEIANMASAGIFARAANSKVTVSNTVLRDNGYGVWVINSVVAVLDGLHIKNSSYGVLLENGPRVTVSNSVVSGSNFGVSVSSEGGATRAVVERSVVGGGLTGIIAQTFSAGDVVEVTASHNALTDNTVAGVAALQTASSSVTVVADGNTVAGNAIGFQLTGTPTIYTRGNNTLKFNTTDVSGGTLTALAAQ